MNEVWQERWARGRPGTAFLALTTSWVALIAWSGMVAHPRRYLVATLLIGAVMTLTGIALRILRVPAYGVVGGQVVVALLGLNLLNGAVQSFLWLVPTRASVERTWWAIIHGGETLNQYSSPVQVNPHGTGAMLTVCGLGVIVAVDALALGWRQAPLAALPLLAALSVPVSILRQSLALPVFIVTALLFLRLVASDHLSTFGAWGRTKRRPPGATLSTFWQVAVSAVVVALICTPLVPVSNLLKHHGAGGGGIGSGAGFQLTTVNPFIRLRRDLVEKTHTPLLYAETKSASTSYVRTTVLDEFTSDEWRPSPRTLPGSNDARGIFPAAPGLSAGINGQTDTWKLSLDPHFATAWLPLPYPVVSLEITGAGWRYDSRTLDVVYVNGEAPTPLTYSVKAFTPDLTQSALRTPLRAPLSIREPMTKLPAHFPEVIRTQAEKVTKGADTNFDKAVALQTWFRTGGGFTYSLDQRGGSGMDLLAHFVTDDRVGYCEQFASAMAAMGRALGIPSRVVVGFLDGQPLPDGRILYTSDERHAWTEMYFPGSGWVRFEPTPAQRAAYVPAYTQSKVATQVPTQAPTTAPSKLPGAKHDPVPQDVSSSSSSSFSIPWPLVGAVLVLALLLIGPSALRRVQRRRRLRAQDPVHLAEGAWAELGATARDLGLDWPEHRSPREQAGRVTAQVPAGPEDVAALEGLLGEVERGRYAAPSTLATIDPDDRSRTVHTLDSWRHAMGASVQHPWRARLWPRSLWRRG